MPKTVKDAIKLKSKAEFTARFIGWWNDAPAVRHMHRLFPKAHVRREEMKTIECGSKVAINPVIIDDSYRQSPEKSMDIYISIGGGKNINAFVKEHNLRWCLAPDNISNPDSRTCNIVGLLSLAELTFLIAMNAAWHYGII
jgi:hypothetical protein